MTATPPPNPGTEQDLSCNSCLSSSVCLIFGSLVALMTQNYAEENFPFHPSQVGELCLSHTTRQLVQIQHERANAADGSRAEPPPSEA